MHAVRTRVKENVLSHPDAIALADYERLTGQEGEGVVCEHDGVIVGFAIAEVATANVWALFVDPAHERKGIGRALQDALFKAMKRRGLASLWLTTERGTRAEGFYRASGWVECENASSGDARFERSIG